MNEREPAAIHFQLQGSRIPAVDVQLRRSGPRWVATALIGERQIVAIGMSAREALRVRVRASRPHSRHGADADLGLLGPSVELLHMEAATVA